MTTPTPTPTPTPTKPVNVASKSRKVSAPYASWSVGDWHFKLLKSWQVNNRQPYARWFMAVSSPMTFGSYDLGDTYTAELLPYLRTANNLTFDATIWFDRGTFLAWAFSKLGA